MKRREAINAALLLSTGLPFSLTTAANAATSTGWRMPDEAEPHSSTWMAFGANKTIWGAKLLPEVQRNLALIANTIAKYEPVNMLVNSRDLTLAQSLVGKNVTLHVCPLDDLWMRDTGPVFVNKQGKKAVFSSISTAGVKSRRSSKMLWSPVLWRNKITLSC